MVMMMMMMMMMMMIDDVRHIAQRMYSTKRRQNGNVKQITFTIAEKAGNT